MLSMLVLEPSIVFMRYCARALNQRTLCAEVQLSKLKIGINLALLIHALDLTTSLIPSVADRSWPVRAPGLLEISIRLCLVAPLVWHAYTRRHSVVRWAANSRIPRVAQVVLFSFILVELSHIALRYERFPFTPVAMFSNALRPVPKPVTYIRPGYLALSHNTDDRGDLLSLFQAGQTLEDYKTGWIFRQYGLTHSLARDYIPFAVGQGLDLKTITLHPRIKINSRDQSVVRDHIWFCEYTSHCVSTDSKGATH